MAYQLGPVHVDPSPSCSYSKNYVCAGFVNPTQVYEAAVLINTNIDAESITLECLELVDTI